MIFMRLGFLAATLPLLTPLVLFAQTVPAAPLPKDPASLMSLAHEKNGLNSPDVQPWHIRGTYTIYDGDGKPEDLGVYEEWWISPTEYKRSYNGTKLKQIEYATRQGLFREGAQDWPGGKQMEMRTSLIEPIPDEAMLKEFKLEARKTSSGNSKLACVVMSFPIRSNLVVSEDFFPTSCFEPTIPSLRVSSRNVSRTIYNQIVIFQGHYIAREINSVARKASRFEIKLDLIEALKQTADDLLSIPANALPIDLTSSPMKLAQETAALLKLKGAVPSYPEAAKDRRIQGTVAMQATIGKDGHIVSLQVMSGPNELRQAAVDAVRQWVYQPFRVMGQPLEVTTEIKVNFNIG